MAAAALPLLAAGCLRTPEVKDIGVARAPPVVRAVYSVEWWAVFQLSRLGITAAPVKEGDHLIVTGSINRNPEKRILTLVREISRPTDGWHWANPDRTNPSSTTK